MEIFMATFKCISIPYDWVAYMSGSMRGSRDHGRLPGVTSQNGPKVMVARRFRLISVKLTYFGQLLGKIKGARIQDRRSWIAGSPSRNVDRHASNDPTDKSSTRHGQDPTNEDLSDLLPVQALEITVSERHADYGTRNALCGADGQTKLGGEENGDCGRQFHAVAACR